MASIIKSDDVNSLNKKIQEIKENGQHVGSISDGYHTFDELYHHRAILTASLFRQIPFTWKAKIHEDGTMFDDMFIVGVVTPDGHATYHYDLPYWDIFKVPEIPHAPRFDGHTPKDAIDRIERYFTKGTLMYDQNDTTKIMSYLSEFERMLGTDRFQIYMNTFYK